MKHRFQNESDETISPWFREPSAQIVFRLTLSLTNRTEPSVKTALAPPGWRLARPNEPPAFCVFGFDHMHAGYFGLGPSVIIPKL